MKGWSNILFTVHYSPFARRAFTLAEVLITLGIIGTVAAMTIPVLMNNIQDAEFKGAWKKDFSVLENATQQIMQDYGNNISPVITTADDTMRNLYEPYLKLAKPCPEAIGIIGKCWHNDNTWFLLGNSPVPDSVTGLADLLNTYPAGDILADGTLVRYVTYNACSSQGFCGYILVDVNGFKKPNTVGKDIFGAMLYTNKLVRRSGTA